MATDNNTQEEKQFGLVTRIIARSCHNCKMCSHIDRKPDSALGKLMRWHRTWCPAWSAHTKVYGEKPLSQ
jgi:hypothetical protein